jgi:biotin synthase-related radical SAM superfamily protein
VILRASYGTLGLLGIVKGKLPPQRTAYFMLDGKCVFDCDFCTHARSAKSDNSYLSRIVWKEVDPVEAARILKDKENVKRVCFQVVSYKGYFEDTLKMIELFSFKPVSVSVRATSIDEVREYFKAGADMVGLSIDVASPELYEKIRGGKMETVLDLLERSSEEFPGKITTHLIVGMGEADEELIKLFEWLAERNITIALFAFTPLKGTKMENHPRPSLERYRKIQLARWLIQNGYAKYEDFEFDDTGNLVKINVDYKELEYKKAFLTSGCPDCTRPYYNESPAKELYNIHDESLLDELEGVV